MGRFTFDENDEKDEPTFSLHDFKKWLTKQGKADPNIKNESVPNKEEKPPIGSEQEKEQFKQKLRNRHKKKD